MKVLNIWLMAGLIALTYLSNIDVVDAQGGPEFSKCAWPLEISPEGIGNFLAPDDQARYWLMPFDPRYLKMEIKGHYPQARYFSFVAYNGDKDARPVEMADHLYDANIIPDLGSNNPFHHAKTSQRPINHSGNDSYTVNVTRNGTTNGNTIKVDGNYAWVVLRMYVPSADRALSGQALRGGVPLPNIKLYGSGTEPLEILEPCPTKAPEGLPPNYPVRSINKLSDVRAFLELLFPPGVDINQASDYDQPAGNRIWFAPPWNPPPLLLPNPDNKYLVAIPGPYQPGRLIVIHGKAPSFPDTYAGLPSHLWGTGRADMRYWSICNNDLALPVPAVRCLADQGLVTQGGYYTIVISDDLIRPHWLRPKVNWLPWGDEQYHKQVFFRNLIPVESEAEYGNADIFPYAIQKVVIDCWKGKGDPALGKAACLYPNAVIDFFLPDLPPRADVSAAGPNVQQIMGDYYPVAAWCDKTIFMNGGWRACLRD